MVDMAYSIDNARAPRFVLARPVFFIGFMGAGKTTLTRRLARTCGLSSVDIDRCIERREGRPIKQLFADVGEAAFRDMEADTLHEFVGGEPLLISCGGGIVMGERSRACIASDGFTVYMHVTPDESADRISNPKTRPFFETMESVRNVNEQRLPYYQQLADITVDTSGKSVGVLAREVQEILVKEGVLCPVRK